MTTLIRTNIDKVDNMKTRNCARDGLNQILKVDY